MWKIPLFDTGFDDRETEAVQQVLDSGWLTMGEQAERFEREFADFINVKHAIAVSNGTAALHLFDFYRRNFGYNNGFLPVTEEVAQREVTLPLYPSMKDEDVHYICDSIVECMEQRRS